MICARLRRPIPILSPVDPHRRQPVVWAEPGRPPSAVPCWSSSVAVGGAGRAGDLVQRDKGVYGARRWPRGPVPYMAALRRNKRASLCGGMWVRGAQLGRRRMGARAIGYGRDPPHDSAAVTAVRCQIHGARPQPLSGLLSSPAVSADPRFPRPLLSSGVVGWAAQVNDLEVLEGADLDSAVLSSHQTPRVVALMVVGFSLGFLWRWRF
ncbi:hypothetical protein ACP70R_027900 [Stipagrostis hirtigluma subsp. patula]